MTKYTNAISYNPASLTVTLKKMKNSVYYIVGRCISGSRHYSESLTWDEVEKEFGKYVGVVDYFGGGIVDVYTAAGDVCHSQVVMNFDF